MTPIATLSAMRIEVWQGLRQIRRSAVFSTIVVLLLSLGLGTSVAIFSTVRTVRLSPLPYKDADRLVQIIARWPKTGDQNDWSASSRDALDWKASVPAFEDVAVYRYMLLNLTEAGQAESLYGLRVTANLLPMLGIAPSLGEWFSQEDDRPGNTHTVVLSDDLWHRRFQADPTIVGKVVHFNGEGYLVKGVMPRGFNFPLRLATQAQLPSDQMQYWIPLGLDLAREQHGNTNSGVIARLRPGVSVKEAQLQLEAACRILENQYPATNTGLSAVMLSLREQTVSQVNRPLIALLSAAGLILLLACANIASLLLARGESIAHELAVRLALGGSLTQVARIPLLQGMLLSLIGCFLGVPAAAAMLRLLIHLAPIDVPRLAATRIDLFAVTFGIALSSLCGLLVGGLSAFQVVRRSPREVLSGASTRTAGQQRTGLRSSLVVFQIALAVVLLTGAGLMLRTFVNLLSADTGYHSDHVFYAVNVLPAARYPDRPSRLLFFQKVLDRLHATSGVESSAVATGLPLVGQYGGARAQAQHGEAANNAGVAADLNEVSPGYLETMGVRLISGRSLQETDTGSSPKVVIIDSGLARSLWPGHDPLGHRVNIDGAAQPVWREVVGVVAQTRNRSLDISPRPGLYVPLTQGGADVNFVIIKTRSANAPTILKNVISSVDPNQSVFFSQSMSELMQDSIATRHFLFLVLSFFALSAALLSAVGMYGLVSFIAASRTREVGIRMALGGTRGNIARLMVFRSLRLALVGLATGLLASLLLTRALSSLLFGVRPMDSLTLFSTMLFLLLVTAIAAFTPALRSALLNPMHALRSE